MPRKLLVAGFLSTVAGIGFGAPAFGASQGQLGAVSIGSIGVSVTKAPMVVVSGSGDVLFAQGARDGGWSADQRVCVHGRGLAGYRVTVAGATAAVHVDGLAASDRLIPVKGGEAGCDARQQSTLTLAGAAVGGSVVTLMVVPE